jgi:hypothetical protein
MCSTGLLSRYSPNAASGDSFLNTKYKEVFMAPQLSWSAMRRYR